MTTPEMHIEVNLGVQGLGPSRFDDFLEEEIDYALTKAQSQLVKQSYSFTSRFRPGGFEESEKRINDLAGLIASSEIDTYVIDEGYSTGAKFTTVAADLPADHMFTINNKAQMLYDGCNSISKPASPKTFKFYSFSLAEVPSLNNFGLYALDGSSVVNILLKSVPKISTKGDLIYWLINAPQILKEGYTVYYEKAEDLYLSGELIVVYDGNTHLGVKESYSGAPDSNVIDAFQTHTTTRQYRIDSGLTSKEVRRLRFVQQDDIDTLLRDPFNTTTLQDPLVTMNNKKLIAYESGIFIVRKLFLRYLKQPRRISLSLGLDCELAEHMHSEIVQGAVQILLSDTSNPRVGQAENDLLRTE